MIRFLIAMMVCCLLVPTAGFGQAAGTPEKKKNLIGVYLYTDRFAAAAKEQQRDMFDLLDEHLQKLAATGVNCVTITIHDASLFGKYVELAKKHQIQLMPELDFAYFRVGWSDEEMKAHATLAIDFLKTWHADPQVEAWSIKEEPNDADIARLDQYYRMIWKGVPEVQFYLVTSGGGWLTANAADLPFKLVGGDYYYFSWNQGLAEEAHTLPPNEALYQSRWTTELYRRASAKFNTDRIHVFGVAACTIPDRAQGFVNGTLLPESWTPEQKSAYTTKVKELARRGEQGWSVYDNVPGKTGPQYSLWTLYMPPPNATRALMWGSIMEGAKLTFAFSYSPYSRFYNPDSPLDAIQNFPDRTERFYADLAGRPGEANPRFDEFAAAVKQVRCYDNILPYLTIQPESPLRGEAGERLFAKAFKMDGFDGRVLIVHNANVGYTLCPDCQAKHLKSCEHVFIDDHGELKYFHPQKTPDMARMELPGATGGATLFDISTGKLVPRSGKTYMLPVLPGDGKLLYLGKPADAAKLHQLYLAPKP